MRRLTAIVGSMLFASCAESSVRADDSSVRADDEASAQRSAPLPRPPSRVPALGALPLRVNSRARRASAIVAQPRCADASSSARTVYSCVRRAACGVRRAACGVRFERWAAVQCSGTESDSRSLDRLDFGSHRGVASTASFDRVFLHPVFLHRWERSGVGREVLPEARLPRYGARAN